ncbi:lipase family protein [Actomonas aquatica]|uniref:Lipase family protein n=1 Tax=Actomonas aquatica TaxID=2866162 RepID=A0ABZ1CAR6_9BACT|nr:lipase family protein [Opitutus sp. WL0086]WRQ88328.1 lipase family protein [Opitutus sp. WL0086]
MPAGPMHPAAWSVSRAALFAQLALLVYVPDEGFVRETAARAGYEHADFFDRGDSQAWLFTSATEQVVVFRGTEPDSTADVLTDLQVLPTRLEDGSLVHGGFARALDQLRPELDAALATDTGKTIWLTGHSLGGALAQLYGRLRRSDVAVVYTFGGPRVFAETTDADREVSPPCFRVTLNNDLIPHLPLPPPYEHVGEEYHIDAAGALHRNPSWDVKWKASLQGHRDYLRRWFRHATETGSVSWVPGDALADHAPLAYVEALVALTLTPVDQSAR